MSPNSEKGFDTCKDVVDAIEFFHELCCCRPFIAHARAEIIEAICAICVWPVFSRLLDGGFRFYGISDGRKFDLAASGSNFFWSDKTLRGVCIVSCVRGAMSCGHIPEAAYQEAFCCGSGSDAWRGSLRLRSLT
jgi:hypothetical protein